jgi:hypothetical protein
MDKHNELRKTVNNEKFIFFICISIIIVNKFNNYKHCTPVIADQIMNRFINNHQTGMSNETLCTFV